MAEVLMNKAIFGSLVALSMVAGCGKDKSDEKPAAVKSSVRKSRKARERKPEPAPAPPAHDCTFAQGEHARPPSWTIQNGLPVEAKGKPYTGTTDATIEKSAATTNAGSDPTLVQKGGKNPRHSLVRWDLSALPAKTTIEGACMAVFIEDASGQAYTVLQLLRDWSEAKVTWNSATAEVAWATPGGWGGTDSGDEATVIPAKATGLQTVALPTALVQKWITDKGENHGLIIGNDRSFDGMTLSSANSPTANQRPTLLLWK
jgi:hypothetical protein